MESNSAQNQEEREISLSEGDFAGAAEEVAIIGMAGRFPGARDLDTFWQNLRDGVESISFFSAEELVAAGVSSESLADPDYVRAGVVLPDAEYFDAAFFGYTPRDAEIMDPQQRVFLECAWEALEHAGYDAVRFPGLIGVFAGAGLNSYLLHNIYGNRYLLEAVGSYQMMLLNEKDYLSTRVSYKLDLKGPSMTVQTACSSSLVAVHHACQNLLSYQCDMALAGGVAIHSPQIRGYRYQEGMILAPDGHCRAFDARAQGTVGGSGVGIVVLKRLSDALAAGDTIDAVIKGSAINNDGACKVGYTAPSVQGQAEVIVAAQSVAGVDPTTITYVEAHGTGTPLGDPIEVAALTQAFRAGTQASAFCALGSVKTNIGHPDAAAGIAGLIKTTLALKHGQIPPSLHYERPNPKIDFANSPFYVNTALAEWRAGSWPRRAGISSFGIGGTNAHAIIEEAPQRQLSDAAKPAQLLLISAKTPTALETATANLAAYLTQHSDCNLADVACTLQQGRRELAHRRAIVCRDRDEAIAALTTRDPQHDLTTSPERSDPPILFMFPGQGSQHLNMGRDLYSSEPVFRQTVDRCAEILAPLLGVDMRSLLYPTPDRVETARQSIEQTSIAQPALFVVEYALAQLWLSWGIRPQAMIGHSVGEYVAACLAGVFTLEAGLALLAARGRLMQSLERGAMLSVRLSAERVSEMLSPDLALAADNSPALSVVSGPLQTIAALQSQLEKQGVPCQYLHTSHAFHSAMMDPILAPFVEEVRKVDLHSPQIPYISNESATWVTTEQATDPHYWARHLRQTVRFTGGIRQLLQTSSATSLLLEVGPGQTLCTLTRQTMPAASPHLVLPSLGRAHTEIPDYMPLLGALGRLWLAGAAVDWNAFHAGQHRQRVHLPTYPFERKRHWVDPPPPTATPPFEQPSTTSVIQSEPLSTEPLSTGPPSTELQSAEPPPAETPSDGLRCVATPPQLELRATRQTEQTEMKINTTATPTTDRVGRILTELMTVIEHVAGIAPADMNMDAHFLELGFDSLLLVQLSQALQRKFEIKFTIIQLLEEISTPAAVLSYLDACLLQDEVPPVTVAPQRHQTVTTVTPVAPVPTAVTQKEVPARSATRAITRDIASAERSRQVTVPTSALERLIAQQLEVMAQQLALLGAAQTPDSSADIAEESLLPDDLPNDEGEGSILASCQSRLTAPTVAAGLQQPQHKTSRDDRGGLGPFQPLQKSLSGNLTPQQQQYLSHFTARYTQRTATSKRQTQENRQYLADPRTIVGFRPFWKELTYPIISTRSQGAKLWDVDGNEYIDLVMGFGTNLFGHAPQFITAALQQQLTVGVEIGPQSQMAGKVARLLCDLTGMERAALLNTGSEAVMTAIRIARAVTGRNRIALFSGAYHGNFDGVLVRPKTTVDGRMPTPIAAGTPSGMIQDVLVLEYGSPESLEVLRAQLPELAAILVEPVQSRQPELQPGEFLHALRAMTMETDTALIFDDMVMGFRLHPRGSQGYFGVEADIATYGKIVGGAMPIGVIAGKARYMDAVDGGFWSYGDASIPQADLTFYASTFCKHPLALAGAWAVLNEIKAAGPDLQANLNRRTAQLASTLNAYFAEHRLPVKVVSCGSLFKFRFESQVSHPALFYYHLLYKGVHLWEGRNAFLSTAHSDADVQRIIQVIQESVQEMRSGGFLPTVAPPTTGGNSNPSHQETATAIASPGSAEPHDHRLNETRRAPAQTAMMAGRPQHSSVPGNGHQEQAQQSGTMAAGTARHSGRNIAFSLCYFGDYNSEFRTDKYRLLLEGARFGDRHGFEAVWIPERHFHSFGGFSPNPSVLAAALARETERIHIRAGSVVLPLHHPVRVAEEWSVVDNLSGGRIGVAFASGWHPNDFALAPQSYANRKERLTEGIATIRRLWQGETVTAQGGTGNAIELQLFPMPTQRELPVWQAGGSLGTFLRAGALGTGVLTNLQEQTVEELGTKIALYRQALAEHGHDPQAGRVTVLVHTFMGADITTAREKARRPFYEYVKSSLAIRSGKIASQGGNADVDAVDPADMEALLASGYNKYLRAKALIGTVESCTPIVDSLIAAGVDEIACLIDFGIDAESVLDGLQTLALLRERYVDAPTLEAVMDAALIDGGGSHAVVFDTEVFNTAVVNTQAHTLPLTEMQQEVWLETQKGEEASCAYIESYVMHLRGALNVEALRNAVQSVIRRHEALRTTFSAAGEQCIHGVLTLDVPVVDYSHLLPDQRHAETTERLQQESEQPFDLVKGPLLRASVIKLTAEHHLFVFTYHHLILDGVSLGSVFEELGLIYSATCLGTTPTLIQPMPYSEYARQQRSPEQQTLAMQAETYWRDQFRELPPILDLPTDHIRPAIRTYASAEEQVMFDGALYEALKTVGVRQRATLFTTLLASYNVFLSRLTGQSDLVVGIMAAGQGRIEGRTLIGHCVNLLPVRCRLDSCQTFAAYLADVRRSSLTAMEHQDCGFGHLVRTLALPRDPARMPLISTLFNLDRVGSGADFVGLQTEIVANPRKFTVFDIWFNFIQSRNGLKLACIYNPDLFEKRTIQRWLAHFQTLLENIAASPELRLFELPLLTATEHGQLASWNDTAAEYPDEVCIHELFAAQAERSPNAIAVKFEDRQFTYRELNRRANQLAHHLRATGIGPETPVGICVDRSLEMVIGLLGILKAGGAYVPLDPAYPQDRLEFIARDADIAILLTQQHLRQRLPAQRCAVVDLDEDWDAIARCSHTDPEARGTADDLAYIIYTSGSTGRPKGVQLSHRAVVNFLTSLHERLEMTPEDIHLGVASMSFDASVLDFYVPLTLGACLVVASREATQDGSLLANTLKVSGATMMHATPSTWRILVESGWQGEGNIKILTGGEHLPWDLACQLTARSHSVWNLYGPTETAVYSSVHRIANEDDRVYVGTPLRNTQLYALDSHQQLVPPGIPGELYIGGAGLARGYLNRPELTEEKFTYCHAQGQEIRLYRTGDLVRYDPNGRFEFLGRLDQQIKLRGYRIELGEIETVLMAQPSIQAAAVIVREDAPGDRRLVAYLVAASGVSTPNALELRVALRAILPEYMVPAAFVILERLPLTPSGKIDRKSLPAPEQGGERTDGYVAPRNAFEQELVNIWSEVLRVEQIGIHDDFFDQGGHSLLAVQLVKRIKHRLGRDLPLVALFQDATVACIANRLIGEVTAPTPESTLHVIQPTGNQPPLFCVVRPDANPLGYRTLGTFLGNRRPYYLLQSQVEKSRRFYNYTEADYERLATEYIQVMKQAQPEGPYFLFGMCEGSYIALEMARQLQSVGQQIAMLAVIDTWVEQNTSYRALRKLNYYLTRIGSMFRDWQTAASVDSKLTVLAQHKNKPPDLEAQRNRDFWDATYWPGRDFKPSSFDGRITLFRIRRQPFWRHWDKTMGWGARAKQGLDICIIPGGHLTLFREPYVQALAEQIQKCLDRIET
jgi:iturin family lipopeptide synthetase A